MGLRRRSVAFAAGLVLAAGLTACGAGTNARAATPTAATCPAPTPAAPVTGYTVSQCEDFNNGLGAFSPYVGGGAGTVVGTGRVASQCTDVDGMLELKQNAAGATCGGWMTGFDQRYGYWEVRMKVASTGTSGSPPHPVLILWPGNGQWTSELDFFETNVGNPAGGFLHCSGSNPSANCFILPSNNVDYSQWHTYGIQWTPTSMTGYIDGTQWWTSNNTSSFQPLADSNLTIQLDNLSGSTPVDPAEMDVDWAHMYKPGTSTASPTPSASPTASTTVTPTPTPTPTASPSHGSRYAASGEFLNAHGGGPAVDEYDISTVNDDFAVKASPSGGSYVNLEYVNSGAYNGRCIGDSGNAPAMANTGFVNCTSGNLGWSANFTQVTDGCPIGQVAFKNTHWTNGWLAPGKPLANGTPFYLNDPKQTCFTVTKAVN